MTIGVILSTYNNPKWLEKTLWGYEMQTRRADEIIVADDGSGPETADLIRRFEGVLPIRHVWHEDRGFRKTTILNRALRMAESDYIVVTDQDCVPRPDFLATHERMAQRGRFLSGGYFKLPMDISLQLTRNDITSGQAFSLSWLRRQGLKWSFKCTKLFGNAAFAGFMNHITPTHATWNGMNSSGWRTDLLAANGFDERMQYGGEDRELGERLTNAGICGKQIRYSAIVLHLDHSRPYVNEEAWRINNAIREATRRQHLIRTEYGIVKSRGNGTPADGPAHNHLRATE